MLDERAIKLYESGMSIREVCKEVDTYPSKLYRFLESRGVKMRTKSEAQSKALKTGKVQHPTKGKERKDEVKLKISQALSERWNNLTNKELEYFSTIGKKRWDARSDKDKEAFRKAGLKAIRKAAEEGSKMEFFMIDLINKAGFQTFHHKTKFLANIDLEVDILVPKIKTVIEIDGPSHQLPIWGEEAFQKRQKLDMEKNGLLLQKGYVVIRFKFNNNKVSLYNRTKAANEIIELLKSIKNKFPTKDDRYHEIKIDC